MYLALTSLPSENLKLTAVIGLRTIGKTERRVVAPWAGVELEVKPALSGSVTSYAENKDFGGVWKVEVSSYYFPMKHKNSTALDRGRARIERFYRAPKAPK